MSETAAPCRLFVMLAREAAVAVVFRRGPSKLTQVFRWDTDTDTFEPGNWFHGQLYPERGDLSPDGTKLVYFAAKHYKRNRRGDFPETWTALSKPPWLTALTVWPNAGSTYYGGGLFASDTELWVNPVSGFQNAVSGGAFLEDYPPPPGMDVRYDHPFWDHHLHNMTRLEMGGWEPVEPYPAGSIPVYRLQPGVGFVAEPIEPDCPLLLDVRAVHRKLRPGDPRVSLVMTSEHHYPGGQGRRRSPRPPDDQTFAVEDRRRGAGASPRRLPLEGAVWADWDRQGRLLYAKEGRLFTADIRRSGEFVPAELLDLNPRKPGRILSPDWAKHW
jgi:hypothetical protein